MPVLSVSRTAILNYPHIFPFVFLPIVILLSVLSFYFLETPARRWLLSRMMADPREDLTTQAAAQ